MLIRNHHRPPRRGFVLIAVLMVITVLTLAAYQYSALMSAEVTASERIRKSTEAKALADSGVHHFTALVADPNAFEGTLGANPFDNPAAFQGVQVSEGQSARSRGKFSLVSLDHASETASTGTVPVKYGAADETGKLNINALYALDSSGEQLHDALMKLPDMTEEIAWSIVDWIDTNQEPSAGGAETEYYGSLPTPYETKNGPLDTVEELLLVKGVTPSLLFGSDRNRNGKLDIGEDDGLGYSAGWAAFLTVYSRERNVDSEGQPRINLNGNDLKTLLTDLEPVLGADLTTYLLAYRLFGSGSTQKQKQAEGIQVVVKSTMEELRQRVAAAIEEGTQPRQRISSLFALIDARVSITQTQKSKGGGGKGGGKGGPQQPTVTLTFQYDSPLADAGKQAELMGKLLDKTTTQQGLELPARVNVNTAPREVLLALPGMTDALADAIVAKRPQWLNGEGPEPRHATVAWLLDGTVPVATLRQMERYVTARTQVYRVQSIGYFEEGGPMARVEAVIDSNQGAPRVVYYRDLSDLGRAIDPRSSGR